MSGRCLWGVCLGVSLVGDVSATTPQDAAVWLSFTNTAGSVANDDSGHGNHGALGGAVSFMPGGGPTLPGGETLDAALFSGVNSAANSVLISASPSMDFPKTQGSIVFWLRPDSLPSRSSYVKTDNFGSGDGLDIQKNSAGLFASPKGWNSWYKSSAALSVGLWIHVAYTWESATQTPQFFINGQYDTGATWPSGVGNFSGLTTTAWRLGWDLSVSDRPLTGRMADFAVFTNVLSAAEVFSVYSNGVAGITGESEPPPLQTTGFQLTVR